MATATAENQELRYLNDQQRLEAVNAILAGCGHLYSKNRLQDGTTYYTVGKKGVRQEHKTEDKLTPLLKTFIGLAENDPIFMAHFLSYAIRKSDSKDLKLLATFANSLSDADGTPFSPGSKYLKPNLRVVSQAAVQTDSFDTKQLLRLVRLANSKRDLSDRYKLGKHFTRSLKTAVRNYLLFREHNPKVLQGMVRSGFKGGYKKIYRTLGIRPSDAAAAILGWNQQGKTIEKVDTFGFKDLSDIEIAQKIRDNSMPLMGALGALSQRGDKKKMTPVLALALLEQASGNQAVILREMFDEQGLLKDPEVLALYESKVKTATTALDRVDRLNTEVDPEVNVVLKKARAESRKNVVGVIPKMFLMVDISPSMEPAIALAKRHGATIAEAIPNPEENFFWGVFNHMGTQLQRPATFEKDAFAQALYGWRTSGGTNVMACWEMACRAGASVIVMITDEAHNPQNTRIEAEIDRCVALGLPKPKSVVVVHITTPSGAPEGYLRPFFESREIGFVVLKPSALEESALVAQTIRDSIKGQNLILDEIMSTELLKLPKWWAAIDDK